MKRSVRTAKPASACNVEVQQTGFGNEAWWLNYRTFLFLLPPNCKRVDGRFDGEQILLVNQLTLNVAETLHLESLKNRGT